MLRPDRCEIAKELYWGKGRRPRPEDDHALHVTVRLARDANVFLDIGAYTGLFSIATTSANVRLIAHAFEIVPAAANLLEQNARRNAVSERLHLHREGIGVPDSTMTVPSGEGGSAVPSFYSSEMSFQTGEVVSFRSLDSLEDLVVRDDRVVIKIDVEGTELDVFEHGTEFLAAHRPSILCEVLHGRARAHELSDILTALEYQMYSVRQDGLLSMPRVAPHQEFRDWLFTPFDARALRDLGLRVGSER